MSRVFDWVSRHDPRSLAYPIREVIGTPGIKPRSWNVGTCLDQGNEGACVGFGWTGELLASPDPCHVDEATGNAYALRTYHRAQQLDEWPGESYDGTSVLAGAKTIREARYMDGFRWAFSIDDVRDTVIAHGPVVIGIPWHQSMYETKPSGLVVVDGPVVGGHCILVYGYHPSARIRGEDHQRRFEVFRWRNSWGPSYGIGGNGYVRYEDLRDLLAGTGEACVPLGRHHVTLT